MATAALFKAGVSKKNISKVKEVISGSVPVCQRLKLLKLLDSATEIYVESARAISRKASHGEELYNIAKEKGVSIICSDFPQLFSLQPSPIESFMRKLVLAMQELERDVLVERMQAGLAAKKKITQARTQSGLPKVNGRKSTLELLKPSPSKVKKMIVLSKKRSKGCFGWRALAAKFESILKIKGGKKLSVETVRRMTRELGSR